MALEVGPGARPVRGGFVLPTRVYVDGDGRPVPAGSPKVARLYAAAGTVISQAEAARLGLSTPVPAAAAEHLCGVCGFEASTKAGLGAHKRIHKDVDAESDA